MPCEIAPPKRVAIDEEAKHQSVLGSSSWQSPWCTARAACSVAAHGGVCARFSACAACRLCAAQGPDAARKRHAISACSCAASGEPCAQQFPRARDNPSPPAPSVFLRSDTSGGRCAPLATPALPLVQEALEGLYQPLQRSLRFTCR